MEETKKSFWTTFFTWAYDDIGLSRDKEELKVYYREGLKLTWDEFERTNNMAVLGFHKWLIECYEDVCGVKPVQNKTVKRRKRYQKVANDSYDNEVVKYYNERKEQNE